MYNKDEEIEIKKEDGRLSEKRISSRIQVIIYNVVHVVLEIKYIKIKSVICV